MIYLSILFWNARLESDLKIATSEVISRVISFVSGVRTRFKVFKTRNCNMCERPTLEIDVYRCVHQHGKPIIVGRLRHEM